MCGIVGFVDRANFRALAKTLAGAVGSLAHRGPDDSGTHFFPESGVGLGHSRLSILDLSAAGHQPMVSVDGRVAVVYNGEIYNFQALRKELAVRGHAFSTRTDTEVVLAAWREWGEGCLSCFVGMFALAVWDQEQGVLFLARDRLGIKPLYYARMEGGFFFASELKALMAFPSFARQVDPASLGLFLHYQYVPGPGTIFKDCFKLSPGHLAVISHSGFSVRPWWQIPDPVSERDFPLSEEEAADELDRLVVQSVSDRLVADVPLGALLSGGVDSSLVAAAMVRAGASTPRTFSIGFPEAGFDEAPHARAVARHLGTDHTELYISPGEALDVVPQLAEMYDEPFADPSAIPTFLVSRLARSQVTVALSGDGGDEQFAGYVRYWMAETAHRRIFRFPTGPRRVVAGLLSQLPVNWLDAAYQPLAPHLPQRLQVARFPDKWKRLLSVMGEPDVRELYRMAMCAWTRDQVRDLAGMEVAQSALERTFAATRGWPVLSRMMRADIAMYLPDAMLTKVDRASMAVGLEVRVPLLDHRLVEFSSRLPDRFKYRNGQAKVLLKKVLARYVPPELFERPKQGFAPPVASWLRGDLKPLMLDLLSVDALKREGLFNPAMVTR
ncbi:MAG: asparagine synthase (glutamine-hydrolyzing), partial [Pseudomonadota bacterium]